MDTMNVDILKTLRTHAARAFWASRKHGEYKSVQAMSEGAFLAYCNAAELVKIYMRHMQDMEEIEARIKALKDKEISLDYSETVKQQLRSK